MRSLMVACIHNGTSSRSQCISRHQQCERSCLRRSCSLDHRAEWTQQNYYFTDFDDEVIQLTSMSLEFLSKVAKGKSGFFSSLFVMNCCVEWLSKAFANPLNFLSTAGSSSFSFFSILSQKALLTTLAFSALRWSVSPWILFAQLRSILEVIICFPSRKMCFEPKENKNFNSLEFACDQMTRNLNFKAVEIWNFLWNINSQHLF